MNCRTTEHRPRQTLRTCQPKAHKLADMPSSRGLQSSRSTRLHQSDPTEPGITRRGHGTGFSYRTPDGVKIDDPDLINYLKALVIPPAWMEVWICPDPGGHIQATGIDDAGRTQYIYHPQWREQQDLKKFDHILDVGDALPRARPKVTRLLHKQGSEGITDQEIACAIAFRLLDTTGIRVGNEEYTTSNGSYGLTTMLVKHVQLDGDTVFLNFPAKSGQTVSTSVRDSDLATALKPLLTRPSTHPALAYSTGDAWLPLSSTHVNDFLREITGTEITAKDFRTWHATVTAARALTNGASPKEAVEEVAEHLQNTPTIAKNSYIDPRVFSCFEQGKLIEASTYRAAERNLRQFVTSGKSTP